MNNLEAAILKRLEEKSDHDYRWPRWAAAYEASEAAMEFFQDACNESYGDFGYAMWKAEQPHV